MGARVRLTSCRKRLTAREEPRGIFSEIKNMESLVGGEYESRGGGFGPMQDGTGPHGQGKGPGGGNADGSGKKEGEMTAAERRTLAWRLVLVAERLMA